MASIYIRDQPVSGVFQDTIEANWQSFYHFNFQLKESRDIFERLLSADVAIPGYDEDILQCKLHLADLDIYATSLTEGVELCSFWSFVQPDAIIDDLSHCVIFQMLSFSIW